MCKRSGRFFSDISKQVSPEFDQAFFFFETLLKDH